MSVILLSYKKGFSLPHNILNHPTKIMLTEISTYLPPFEPMIKLFSGLIIGLFIASFLEALKLTRKIAVFAKPLVGLARLSDVCATSFALAVFSPASANALLGEHFAEGKITKKEVILANLFNSLPSVMVHIPSLFFVAVPILGVPAIIYVVINIVAALLRTVGTIFLGRYFLRDSADVLPSEHNRPSEANQTLDDPYAKKLEQAQKVEKNYLRKALQTAITRFLQRIPRILMISIPIYCLVYYLQFFGYFQMGETWLTENLGLSFLNTKAFSIMMLYMAGELQPALVVAAALYNSGALGQNEVLVALLIGNIISTPMRGLRHQLPAYMGYFRGSLAISLVVANQTWRMLSMIIVSLLYFMVV